MAPARSSAPISRAASSANVTDPSVTRGRALAQLRRRSLRPFRKCPRAKLHGDRSGSLHGEASRTGRDLLVATREPAATVGAGVTEGLRVACAVAEAIG